MNLHNVRIICIAKHSQNICSAYTAFWSKSMPITIPAFEIIHSKKNDTIESSNRNVDVSSVFFSRLLTHS